MLYLDLFRTAVRRATSSDDQLGAGMAEYTLLVSFIAVLLVGALINFRGAIEASLQASASVF